MPPKEYAVVSKQEKSIQIQANKVVRSKQIRPFKVNSSDIPLQYHPKLLFFAIFEPNLAKFLLHFFHYFWVFLINLVDSKLKMLSDAYSTYQDKLYLVTKFIFHHKKELLRIIGMKHFLTQLRQNGIQFSYEILPKGGWVHNEWQFILEIVEIALDSLRVEEAEKVEKMRIRALRRNKTLTLNIIKGDKLRSSSLNLIRSRAKFSLKNREICEKIGKIGKQRKQVYAKQRQFEQEIRKNDALIKKKVWQFLEKQIISDVEILEFRREMKVPFKLDLLLGFKFARVSEKSQIFDFFNFLIF